MTACCMVLARVVPLIGFAIYPIPPGRIQSPWQLKAV